MGLGLAIAGVGLAYSIYANEESKRMQRRQAAEQKAEMMRQASFADIGAARDSRIEAASTIAMGGGTSEGSSLVAAALGIESAAGTAGRELAESTRAQVRQLNLQTSLNAKAGDLGVITQGVKILGDVFKDDGTTPKTEGTITKPQPTVAAYTPTTSYTQTQADLIDAQRGYY